MFFHWLSYVCWYFLFIMYLCILITYMSAMGPSFFIINGYSGALLVFKEYFLFFCWQTNKIFVRCCCRRTFAFGNNTIFIFFSSVVWCHIQIKIKTACTNNKTSASIKNSESDDSDDCTARRTTTLSLMTSHRLGRI